MSVSNMSGLRFVFLLFEFLTSSLTAFTTNIEKSFSYAKISYISDFEYSEKTYSLKSHIVILYF